MPWKFLKVHVFYCASTNVNVHFLCTNCSRASFFQPAWFNRKERLCPPQWTNLNSSGAPLASTNPVRNPFSSSVNPSTFLCAQYKRMQAVEADMGKMSRLNQELTKAKLAAEAADR